MQSHPRLLQIQFRLHRQQFIRSVVAQIHRRFALETAVSVWPAPDNPAFQALQQHYRRTGNDAAADGVEQRMNQFKRRKGG